MFFSAACGKAHRTFIAQVPALRWAVVGKLPTTTGWQLVLPREEKRTRGDFFAIAVN